MSTDPRSTDQAREDRTANSTAARGGASERLWSPTFAVIVALTLFCFLVGQGTNAGTSVYLDRMGASATLAGIGAAVFSAAAAASRLLCGPIIDRRGRAGVIMAGCIITIVGTAGPAIPGSEELFLLWRFLQGMGFAVATTAAATAAADVLPLSRLGEGIGYYGLGQAVSMSIGPALALFLVSTDPAENLYLGFTAAAVCALSLAMLCRYEKNPRTLPESSAYRRRWERERNAGENTGSDEQTPSAKDEFDAGDASSTQRRGKIARNLISGVFEPRALPGTIPMTIMAPAFGFGIFFVGLYGATLGIGNAGVFYTVSAFAMIAVRLQSKSFMDKVAPIKIMAVSAASGLASYALLFACGMFAGGQADAMFYLAGIPYGLCLGLAAPVNQTVAVRNTPPERWGASNALYLLATDIGIGTASIAWGVINDSFGFAVTISCVCACIAASFIAALICYPKPRKNDGANA